MDGHNSTTPWRTRRRGNLRATDLALKSLDYAAADGHVTVSIQHVVSARDVSANVGHG
jgi:hypothetical protein